MKIGLSGIFAGFLLATTLAFASGSCGAGKCGAEMKKEMKGSCGAGKCGSEMKKETKDEMKDAKETAKGSCGTGKYNTK